MFTGFKAIAPGFSHSQTCQDAAEAVVLERVGIALVADGHGSRRHFRSELGARFAVEVAKCAITQFIEMTEGRNSGFWDGSAETGGGLKKADEYIRQLKSNIIYRWREAVLRDLNERAFTEEERDICADHHINPDAEDKNDLVAVYGSTLLGAVITERFWFAIQIGDGACLIITEEGNAEAGIAKDAHLEFGHTTSLCSLDALVSFRHRFGDIPIVGITVASDGVTDSFIPEKYKDFTMRLLRRFVDNPDQAERSLRDFLPKLSERGSNDDVSIAGVFDLSKGKAALER
ncbi:MAG: protein phosphatase 2C domain-containing protein [Spirochaetaceae bacterium]|jgi:serine/threonine protein phosphatase PrpC|nr:protein phosphatase 2C domain-containing protein [Spirochaetaceae bacterium]